MNDLDDTNGDDASIDEMCDEMEVDQLRILKKKWKQILAESANQGTLGQSELESYLAEPPKHPGYDPMKYWTDKQSDFPLLSQLAKKYLSILCSSVDIEREFSTGRWTLPFVRGSISPGTLRQLMLYRSWTKPE